MLPIWLMLPSWLTLPRLLMLPRLLIPASENECPRGASSVEAPASAWIVSSGYDLLPPISTAEKSYHLYDDAMLLKE